MRAVRMVRNRRDRIHRPVQPRRFLGPATRLSVGAQAAQNDRAGGTQAVCCPKDGPSLIKAVGYPARSVGAIPQVEGHTLREHVPRGSELIGASATPVGTLPRLARNPTRAAKWGLSKLFA